MKTILIVDDVELNIDLLTQILEDDFHVIVARDGAQAVDSAERLRPDLILMDIAMPVMDGYEASRIIRKSFETLPIIGLSSLAMAGDAEKARVAGCSDYLTKPVDEDMLMRKIKEYLG